MLEIILFYTFVFLIGTFIGSFLNVVIDRLPAGTSIIYPASHCPHCKHKLGIAELVPIISFFYLKRQCRYCKAKISWYYPIVEIITGGLFLLTSYMLIGQNVIFFLQQLAGLWSVVTILIIISVMIVIFFIDLKYGIIPFSLVIFSLIVLTISYLPYIGIDKGLFINYFLTAVVVFLLFLILFLSTRGRAIGFGDVFFSLLMGYFLGYPRVILGVYTAFLTGAFISLILVVANKKKLKGGTIPFGPFLVFATIMSLFWGDPIIGAFLNYLHVY